MNQQVNIEAYLEDFRTEIRQLKATVDNLTAENTRLNRRIGALNAENNSLKRKIDMLTEENTSLREKLSKYEDSTPEKHSGNSNIPPSKESISAESKRRTTSLREKSGRKSGGQPGHKGSTRLMSENPDLTEYIQPNYCSKCGRDLSEIEGEEVYSEECIGIKFVPVVKRLRYLHKTCICGHCNHTGYVKRKNPVYISSEIRALVVYLNTVMCMPYNRIKDFLHDVMRLDLSEGSIRNFIEQAGKNADKLCERITSELIESPVSGADESGAYINGELFWSWILQNTLLTLTWLGKTRGTKEITKKLNGRSLPQTILVTDRHTSYFSMDVAGHQICIAHLLRNLNYLNELDRKQNWSSRLQELLRKAVHWRNTNPDAVADTSTWIQSLDKLLNENLDNFEKPFRQLRNSLRKLKDYVFCFLEHPEVPCHNNASEGGIRILKVKQKISGGFRSRSGAEDFLAIHSVADTAKKNNFSRWETMLALV